MLKAKILAVITAALFLCAAHAQSPTDGHIAGKSYVNSYFHLSYAWPAMLKPVEVPPAAASGSGPHSYAFLLFNARQENQPFGVTLIAEKLNVAGPHSTGVKSSAEYIDRLAHSLRPGPVLSNISQSEKKNVRGVVFNELNYLQSGKPSSVIATQVGQYLIVFKCNAQSAAEIAQMENSALALRITK